MRDVTHCPHDARWAISLFFAQRRINAQSAVRIIVCERARTFYARTDETLWALSVINMQLLRWVPSSVLRKLATKLIGRFFYWWNCAFSQFDLIRGF